MPSKIYFMNLRARNPQENKISKIEKLFDAAGFPSLLRENGLTGIKIHFGEHGNDTFISPVLATAVVRKVKENKAKPFFFDTNTLYTGSRKNAVDHLHTATEHGFAFSVTGAPVIIADGLRGENVAEITIEKEHFQKVKIAGAVAQADALIVLSHFKGHQLGGFGGALKNLAMGCAPAIGKQEQHTTRFEVKEDDCVACGLCTEICPVGAPTLGAGAASIDKDVCIGCGECAAQCPEQAIAIDWSTDVPSFNQRLAEYAFGASAAVNHKTGYINFLMNITPDCDCVPWSDTPMVQDIGILASQDPVALDAASLDLVNNQPGLPNSHLPTDCECGQDKFKAIWDYTRGDIQLSHAEKINLGSKQYELIEV